MRDPVYVLDSWPLVAWLKGQEPGMSLTDAFLHRAERREIQLLMSIINLGEVYYSIAKSVGVDRAERALESVLNLQIKVVSVSDDQVMGAARLKALHAIAYGDAFAAVLALDRGVPVITGDKELRELGNKGVLLLEWVGTTPSQ